MPAALITKNALVLRDLPLLTVMARQQGLHVNISLSTLNAELARDMEPRTSTPAARLRAMQLLSDAGIPVRVMVAPIIPGLNDHEARAVMRAARAAGAIDARDVMLRWPQTVEPVFREWLERTQPAHVARVQGLIRRVREGQLNDSTWGDRLTGTGIIAEQFRAMFQVIRHKLEFQDLPALDSSRFHPPDGRMRLF